MELDAQLGRWPGESGRLAEDDFVGLRVHSRKPGQARCAGSERKLATIDHPSIVAQIKGKP